MVVSSKIPDRIQREIYIQECSRIMDISEQVLISTLQLLEVLLRVKSKGRIQHVRNCKSENLQKS
jgi:DNA primase